MTVPEAWPQPGSVIESARLRLREIRGEDAPLILEALTDPDFIANVGDRGVHDLAAAQRYITDNIRASYGAHGFGLYLVELRANGAPLGICGLLRRDSHPDVEIGFALVSRARGHGYALEAARATLDFARDTLCLIRVVAVTAPQNQRSIQVLERLGFRSERMVRFAPHGPDRLLGGTVKMLSRRGLAWSLSAVLLPFCLLALRSSAAAIPTAGMHSAGLDPVTLIASAQQAIEAANSGWLPAMKRGDAAAVAAAYAADGVLITPKGASIRGRSAIEARYRAEIAQAGQVIGGGLVQEGVTVSGGLIYEWGHGWLVFRQKDGKRRVSSGPYFTVWRRGSGGTWAIIRNLVL